MGDTGAGMVGQSITDVLRAGRDETTIIISVSGIDEWADMHSTHRREVNE